MDNNCYHCPKKASGCLKLLAFFDKNGKYVKVQAH
jgi:hypothetical protein